MEILFADLKRVLKLRQLGLCGFSGAHDFLLAATVQNLRRMAQWLYAACSLKIKPNTA